DKDFIEKRMSGACAFCALCSRVCPTGALEFRKEGKPEMDNSYLSVAIKSTVVDDAKCVHCGLCSDVCPQACIELQDRQLAEDGSLRVSGRTLIDLNRCVHCGWCASVCPMGAISFEKPFAGVYSRDDNVCQACKTCVHTCPANALFNRDWEAGERGEKVSHRPEACIYCGACAQACPVRAIIVSKTAIIPEMKGKGASGQRLALPAPGPSLTSCLEADGRGCPGCGSCLTACPVKAFPRPDLAAGHLKGLERKPRLEV